MTGEGRGAEPARRGRLSVEAMRKLRQEGLTYGEIGGRVGLSREQVRRLVLQSRGGKPDGVRRKARTRAREQMVTEVVMWLTDRGPTSRASVKNRFGLTESEMAFVMNRAPRHLVFYTTPSQHQDVDPATVSDALRRVWATLEHKHAGLSRALYDQSRDENEPSSTTMVTHRTWAERCQDAGVPPGHPTPESEAYGSRGTTTQALAALTRYLEHCADVEEHATVRGYDRFQREDPTLPSPKTVLARLRRGYDVSSWPAALQLVLDHQASQGR